MANETASTWIFVEKGDMNKHLGFQSPLLPHGDRKKIAIMKLDSLSEILAPRMETELQSLSSAFNKVRALRSNSLGLNSTNSAN